PAGRERGSPGGEASLQRYPKGLRRNCWAFWGAGESYSFWSGLSDGQRLGPVLTVGYRSHSFNLIREGGGGLEGLAVHHFSGSLVELHFHQPSTSSGEVFANLPVGIIKGLSSAADVAVAVHGSFRLWGEKGSSL